MRPEMSLTAKEPELALRLEDLTKRFGSRVAVDRLNLAVDLGESFALVGPDGAGKSSLLNALLGWERSIVSPQPKTTRDVLSGMLTTDRFQCVLFDCAGLVQQSHDLLDELAQHAAVEALQHCSAVLLPHPFESVRRALAPQRGCASTAGWAHKSEGGITRLLSRGCRMR